MKTFLIAAGVKLGKAIVADPVGTITAVVATAPYIIGAGALVGAGYGIYKLVTQK